MDKDFWWGIKQIFKLFYYLMIFIFLIRINMQLDTIMGL